MEMINYLSKTDELNLANELKRLYSSVIIDESYSDQSEFLQNIIALVSNDIQIQQNIRNNDPSCSYRISTAHDLSAAFVKKYKSALNAVSKFAYSISTTYGHAINIASIVGPYALLKLGVADENISFYLTLGMTISNIICDILAKQHSKKLEQMNREDMLTICKTMQKILEKSQNRNKAHGHQDLQIDKSIQEIEKIIESTKA